MNALKLSVQILKKTIILNSQKGLHDVWTDLICLGHAFMSVVLSPVVKSLTPSKSNKMNEPRSLTISSLLQSFSALDAMK